ncbi:fructosamine-3-kinase [Microbacterium sp. AG1240]|nr:fructosamine-3-kinase [Microbacterium sp. AG1240]
MKERRGAPDGFFEAEAAGLAWLRDANGGPRVVGVHDVAPDRISLERVTETRPDAAAASAFGRALAVMHDAGAAAFGAPPDGWGGPVFIGSRRQPCDPAAAWGAFYAEQRVRPFLGPAVEAGNLSTADVEVVHHACDLIAAGAFDDDDRPARLHGDLWSGNVLWAQGAVVLIDPAAHGGHRETDLAMLALFGCPFLDRVLAAYDVEHALRPGWEDRVPLHQLNPLAVHAAGHGSAYGAALADAARRTLALV